MAFTLLLIKIIRKFRRKCFANGFGNFPNSSGVGSIGCGDGCVVENKKYIYFGEKSWFGLGTELLVYSGKLEIGSGVHAQCRTRITCAKNVKIGDNVLIGPDVFITDDNHGMNPEQGGYLGQPLKIQEVIIENGVWLGQRTIVLPGVKIGENSIIGANSVVTHDIPSLTIAVGSPARVVKKWNEEIKDWVRIEQ